MKYFKHCINFNFNNLLIVFLFVSIPFCRSTYSDEPVTLLPLVPDTLHYFTFNQQVPQQRIDSGTDSSLLRHIDSVFTSNLSLKDAFKVFTRLLPEAEKTKSLSRLFESFYKFKSLKKIENDAKYSWYCRKWRNAALKCPNDFLRMCYSDCFYETIKKGPQATPVIDPDLYEKSDTLRIGLYLRDTTSIIQYHVELSRLTWQDGYSSTKFKTILSQTCSASKQNWFTPIPLPQQGIYRAIIYTDDNFRTFYFSIDNISHALSFVDNQSILFHVFSENKNPDNRYTISLSENDTIIQASTNDGNIKLLTLPHFPDSCLTLPAYIECNGTFHKINIAKQIFDERNKMCAYVYTDRSWYRPGDKVHIGGMVKQFTDAVSFSKSSLDSVNVTIETEYSKKKFTRFVPVDTMGHFFDSLSIPTDAPLEMYTATVTPPPSLKGRFPDSIYTDFDIATYKKPSCTVYLSSKKNIYYQSDNIDLLLSARYFHGAPLRYASTQLFCFYHGFTLDTMLINSNQPHYRFRKKYEKGIPHYLFVKNIITDNKGNHSFNFNTDTLFGNGFHTFYGQVRGDDNRIYQAERELFMATDTPFIEIYPRVSPCSTGTSLSLSCFVVEPSGAPVTTDAVCTLLDNRGELISVHSSTTVNGVAHFLFTIADSDSPSQAQVTVNTKSGKPRTIFTEIPAFIRRTSKNDSIHIFTDREKYSHGDTARLTVYWPSNSTSQFVVAGNISMKNYQECNNARRSEFAVPLTADFGSVFFISFVWFNTIKNNFQTAHKQIIMNPDSSIMLSVNGIQSRTFNPGDLCTLKLAVTDKQHNPVKTSFSAAVVDEAVFAITPESDTGTLYSLTPRSYQYPCTLFTESEDFAPDARERIRLIDSLGQKVCIINNSIHKKNKKSILGKSASEFLSYLRYECNNCMWYSMATGGSLDDLVGGLMGGGDGGDIILRGSLNIAAPEFMQGCAQSGSPVRLRKYFTDQAFWANTIFSDTNGNAEVTFRFPDNLTQWRVHLRGSDGNHFLLDYKDSLFTTKKLMIQLETPSFLIENDKSTIQTVVFNNTPDQLPVHVSCKPQNGIILNCKSEIDTVISSNSTISLDWPVSGINTDSATVTAEVLSEKLSDAESRKIPVNRYSVTMQTGKSLILNDSSTIAINILPDNMPYDKRLKLKITSDPVASLMPSLKYLMEYPHGCVEQTMSRFLPDLYVGKLLDTNNKAHDSLRTVFAKFVDQGLMLLSGYQHTDGGWGWWKDDKSSPKMTALVVKGLSCALQTPVSIKQRTQIEKMLKAGIPRLIEYADSVTNDTVLTLYILNSIAQTSYIQSKSKLIDSLMTRLSELKTFYIAFLLECTHSLKLYNYDTLLSAELEKRIQMESNLCWWKNDIPPYSRGDWLFSDVYMTGLVLSALSQAFPDHHLIPSVLQWLYTQHDGEKWLSTAVTSEVIHAIGNCFTTSAKKHDLPDLFNLSINGSEVTPYIQDKKSATFSGYEFIAPDSILKLNNVIKAQVPTHNTLFLSVSMSYRIHPSYINSEKYPIKISRTYDRVDYSIENETQMFPLRNTCTVGDELLVHLQIKTNKPCKYLCLEERFPAGVEVIIPERMVPPKGCIHAEYYPDKCNFYFSDIPAGTTEITYRCRAVFPGEYRDNPAVIEAMYSPEIRGYTKGEVMSIRE